METGEDKCRREEKEGDGRRHVHLGEEIGGDGWKQKEPRRGEETFGSSRRREGTAGDGKI